MAVVVVVAVEKSVEYEDDDATLQE